MAGQDFPSFVGIRDMAERHRELISRRGRPVVGWFCSYPPLEIIRAAGLHAYRIVPGPGRVRREFAYLRRAFALLFKMLLRAPLGRPTDRRRDPALGAAIPLRPTGSDATPP